MPTTTYSRAGHSTPIPARDLADLADLFELVASSERPNLMVPLFGALASSPATLPALLELCGSWGVQLETFLPAMRQAIATLDRLERRRGGRRSVETVAVPNVRAVCSLAKSRAGRTMGRLRLRLERIGREFAEARELEQTRQQIEEFLAERPADGARDLVNRYFGKRPGGDP